jgi:hypothetical protein
MGGIFIQRWLLYNNPFVFYCLGVLLPQPLESNLRADFHACRLHPLSSLFLLFLLHTLPIMYVRVLAHF